MPRVPDDAGLSNRLREALEASGISQGKLEESAGIGDAYLSKLLQGLRPNVGFQTLNKVAEALGVSFEWLATGRGAMRPGQAASDPTIPPIFTATVTELEHRYPNFKAAVPFALAQGCSPEAVERVGSSVHSMPHDPSPMEWYEQIKLEDAILKRAARGLAQDVEREAKQRELDEAKNREMEEATRPKLPKRKVAK